MLTVDVHTHFIPAGVVAAARHGDGFDGMRAERAGGEDWLIHRQGFRYPLNTAFYDLDARLRSMDERQIDHAVVSIAPPLFMYGTDAAEAAGFCREANDALAAFAAGSGGRITAVATLPMQDPDAAEAELQRAVGQLGMAGAELGTEVEDRPLDDRAFRPVLEAAARLGVPLILHPSYVGSKAGLADFYLTNLVGNPLATTVCAARLIFSGALDDLPDLRLVLMHGGGYLPYQIGRLDHGYRVRPESRGCRGAPSEYLSRFWFDTVTHAAPALRFLVGQVGAEHVVYGTDYPFDMAAGRLSDQAEGAGLDAGSLAAVAGLSADALFGLKLAEPGRRGSLDMADMVIDWDVPVPVDDGVVLRADVFRPADDRPHPVILSHGPYAKGLAFSEGYPGQWRLMTERHPDVERGSTGRYQNWEVVDPEKWVPDGYVCVRADSRGAGRSPGRLDPFSPRETRDLYDCIEWAAAQPWSDGKVGLCGISYYAMNQWHVAGLHPPHLAAMCVWEGAADFYRDASHHGGILSAFWQNWYPRQVTLVQHGVGERGARSPVTGEPVAGPETLTDDELRAARADFGADIRAHPLDDAYHQSRSAQWDEITVPFLTAANWGGQGLHTRGNFEGYMRAASPLKWLEVHGLEHWTHFYTDYGVDLQKRFFARFLRGEAAAWRDEPPVRLQVRTVGGFVPRAEREWPLARTAWTRMYLRPGGEPALSAEPGESPATVAYHAGGDGVTFTTPPLDTPTEITGPVAARLFVSSDSADADLFLVLRVLAPDGEEVVFPGAIDPHTPVAQGWLRMSHRKLDPALSTPWRPYHAHDEIQPLVPGQVYPADVEIWPTSVVVPAGYRIALSVRGRDYVYEGAPGRPGDPEPGTFGYGLTGCGWFVHDDPDDRTPEVTGSTQTLWTGPDHPAYVLLPVVPGSPGQS